MRCDNVQTPLLSCLRPCQCQYHSQCNSVMHACALLPSCVLKAFGCWGQSSSCSAGMSTHTAVTKKASQAQEPLQSR